MDNTTKVRRQAISAVVMEALTTPSKPDPRFNDLKVGDLLKSFSNPNWVHTVTAVGPKGFNTTFKDGSLHSYKLEQFRIWGSGVYVYRPSTGKKVSKRKPLEVED